MTDVPFVVGQTYERQTDLHDKYGGQRQGGISTPANAPFVFLFTADSGEHYGYSDGWSDRKVFLYTGEGQLGDMEFVRGNRRIRDHAAEGKALLLFQKLGKGRGYSFVGEFACSDWERRVGPDRKGATREVIVFHLKPVMASVLAPAT